MTVHNAALSVDIRHERALFAQHLTPRVSGRLNHSLVALVVEATFVAEVHVNKHDVQRDNIQFADATAHKCSQNTLRG